MALLVSVGNLYQKSLCEDGHIYDSLYDSLCWSVYLVFCWSYLCVLIAGSKSVSVKAGSSSMASKNSLSSSSLCSCVVVSVPARYKKDRRHI